MGPGGSAYNGGRVGFEQGATSKDTNSYYNMFKDGPLNKKQKEDASWNEDMKIKNEKFKQAQLATAAATKALHSSDA